MCVVGHMTALVWALRSGCELRLITRAAALTRLMDVIRCKSGRTIGSFQGGWGHAAPSFSAHGAPGGGFLHVWPLLPPARPKPEELLQSAHVSLTQIHRITFSEDGTQESGFLSSSPGEV